MITSTMQCNFTLILLGDCIYGTSLLALQMVGARYGYTLINVVKCLDAIFVRSAMIESCKVPSFQRWKSYTGIQVHGAISNRSRLYTDLIEYETWHRTHDLNAATAAAVAQLDAAKRKGNDFCLERRIPHQEIFDHIGGH